jgi:hypothetical protein
MPLRRLVRLARLPRAEVAGLLRAQAMLLRARLLLLTRRRGGLLDTAAASTAPPDPVSPASPEDAARARRLAEDVERASRGGLFRPTCLVRAMALHALLEASHVRGSRIRIGVRWSGSEFAAHAWVEHGGRVLGDRAANVGGYTELGDARLARR